MVLKARMAAYNLLVVLTSRSMRTSPKGLRSAKNEKNYIAVSPRTQPYSKLIHRLTCKIVEEKLGKSSLKRKRQSEDVGDSTGSTTTSSSESEDEDDAGELATEALDSEINAILNAIRSRDPRVYDPKTTFYSSLGHDQEGQPPQEKKEKPMYLRDYHRENLLNGQITADEVDEEVPLTYNEEQEALKRSVVGEINTAAANSGTNHTMDEDDEASDDGFLVTKTRNDVPKVSLIDALDVEQAGKDPETFLSNFMSSRAWVPSERSRFQAFESDDEEEERRAEEFEEAYNFRFEDPAKANEKLTSHARDVASKYSVRREEENARKKRRQAEKERNEAAKRELAEDKARLRKLKIEDAQEKLKKIKQAAGLRGKDLQVEDWSRFLDDTWDDARWEEEMRKRFGEAYYGDEDVENDEEQPGHQSARKKRTLKKPKWDDDIDIGDIVPDFSDDEKPTFILSEDEGSHTEVDAPEINGKTGSKKMSKDYKRERQESKKMARKERKIVELLVDEKLEMDTALLGGPSKKAGFRYRETSPVSYGLSARDILLASDSQLNEFVGLKKLAAFRDPEKKRRDQKRLGKKARLRKWRQETFGDAEGLNNASFVHVPQGDRVADDHSPNMQDGVDIRGEGSKKKRRRQKKSKVLEVRAD
jgi:protein KRI1